MNPKAESLFNRMEAERRALFIQLKSYNDELLTKKPSPKAWSVAEVVDHLITAEEASLKYLQKKTQDTSKARHSGLKGAWRLFAIKTVFNLPIKFKAPTITIPSPVSAPIEELERKWTANREATRQIIAKLNDKELKRELWKHTIAGKMSIYHMLDFFEYHFNRHKKQIDRTLVAVRGATQ